MLYALIVCMLVFVSVSGKPRSNRRGYRRLSNLSRSSGQNTLKTSRSPPVGDSEAESFQSTDRSADGLTVLVHLARRAQTRSRTLDNARSTLCTHRKKRCTLYSINILGGPRGRRSTHWQMIWQACRQCRPHSFCPTTRLQEFRQCRPDCAGDGTIFSRNCRIPGG